MLTLKLLLIKWKKIFNQHMRFLLGIDGKLLLLRGSLTDIFSCGLYINLTAFFLIFFSLLMFAFVDEFQLTTAYSKIGLIIMLYARRRVSEIANLSKHRKKKLSKSIYWNIVDVHCPRKVVRYS